MHPLFAILGLDAGACGSVLLFATPAIIGGAAVYFVRRVNSAKPTDQIPRRPVASEDRSLQDVGH